MRAGAFWLTLGGIIGLLSPLRDSYSRPFQDRLFPRDDFGSIALSERLLQSAIMAAAPAPDFDFQKADSQNATVKPPAMRRSWVLSMKTIRNYSLQSEADLARIALEGADIPAVVVGVGIGMKSGVLLVPEDRIEAALKVLKDLEEQ